MHNARFRVMAGLAGATLCLFATASYGQNTSTQAGTTDNTAAPSASVQTPTPSDNSQATTPATTPDASAQAPATTGTVTTGTETQTSATDATTTTTTGFPGGTLGILAVAVLVLLILFALFRGRDRTVVRESSVSSTSTAPGARSVGTAGGERMNLDPRAASGTTTTSSTTSVNDPNARR
jgi:hypothetical protein